MSETTTVEDAAAAIEATIEETKAPKGKPKKTETPAKPVITGIEYKNIGLGLVPDALQRFESLAPWTYAERISFEEDIQYGTYMKDRAKDILDRAFSALAKEPGPRLPRFSKKNRLEVIVRLIHESDVN